MMMICGLAGGATAADDNASASGRDPSRVASSWWYQPPALLTSLLSGTFGLIGTLLALGFANRNTRLTIGASRDANEASTNQKANEAEVAAIRAKLDAFYGPYLQRSEENRLLARELQSRQAEGFRMLLSLMRPGWLQGLSTADKTIVDEVVANGLELRTMIRERAGLVDPAVLPYLARAGTHFTLLKLAHGGSLDGDPDRFRGFVYPRQLDLVLHADKQRLEQRAALLQSALLAKHAPVAPLSIPSELSLGTAPEPVAQALDGPTT